MGEYSSGLNRKGVLKVIELQLKNCLISYAYQTPFTSIMKCLSVTWLVKKLVWNFSGKQLTHFYESLL